MGDIDKNFIFIFFLVGSVVSQQQFRSDHAQARILKATQQQTVDGSYGFAFEADNGLRRSEVSNNGVVEGSYEYIDSNGNTRTVRYTAGPEGFKTDQDHPLPAPQQQQAAPRSLPPPPAPRFNSIPEPNIKNARPININNDRRATPPPTPIEQAQLAEQQRLLQQNIAQHEQFLQDVASGRVQSAAPRAQTTQNQDFRALNLPVQSLGNFAAPSAFRSQQQQQQNAQFQPQPQLGGVPASTQFLAQRFQPQTFAAPPRNPAQFAPQPQFQQQPQFQPQPQFRPQPQFQGQAPQQQPLNPGQFRVQFAQQPGQGFNYVVTN